MVGRKKSFLINIFYLISVMYSDVIVKKTLILKWKRKYLGRNLYGKQISISKRRKSFTTKLLCIPYHSFLTRVIEFCRGMMLILTTPSNLQFSFSVCLNWELVIRLHSNSYMTCMHVTRIMHKTNHSKTKMVV